MMKLTSTNWPFFDVTPWVGLLAPAQAAGVEPAGRGQFFSAAFHGETRALDYKLYVPGGERNAPRPLVVMLHGCGQTADDFARGTGMNELAESAQCLVLYPEQSTQESWNRCWNWYDKAHHKRDEGEPALIAGLTRSVIEQYGATPPPSRSPAYRQAAPWPLSWGVPIPTCSRQSAAIRACPIAARPTP